MSDVDLTLLAGQVTTVERELRLLRLQMDQVVSAVGLLATGLPQRFGALEQSFHSLAGELSRGFAQMQQAHARTEARLDALQTGLTKLNTDLAANNAELLAAIPGALNRARSRTPLRYPDTTLGLPIWSAKLACSAPPRPTGSFTTCYSY